ncbi:hypothetical protein [Chryseobacterium sp. c4a]|uniref:hypothetical protein n=1 Tax=Chryseobacterium sp. c4a TaxID=1573582 RepID=UPI00135899A2|nr:hypothetical protein [Chryseobacterium sp. c4a]
MKKFLLTATMLVAFTALSKAQQGRVGINTTTPATTLDVVASTDATRPDALLVPRLSRADLEARTGAYANGNATAASAQNGALVFVNALGGTGTGKTVNVTATGFYYYDGTNGNNVWKALGGGGAVALPTWRSDNAANVAILESDANNFVRLIGGLATTVVTLPAPTPAMIGKVFTVLEVTGAGAPAIQTAGGTYKGNNVPNINPFGGYQFVTDGTDWFNTGSN